MNVWLPLVVLSVLVPGCSQAVRPYRVSRPDSATAEAGTRTDGRNSNTNMDNRDPADGKDSTQDSGTAGNNSGTPAQDTPPAPVTPVPATGAVSVTLNIVPPTPAGPYRSRGHIRSLWVTDANNNYIKTIHAFAGQRAVHLKRWQVFTAGALDATSGATQTTDAAGIPVSATWDLKDKAGTQLMTGNYKLWMEFTESNTPALDAGRTPSDANQSIDNTNGYEYYVVPFTVTVTGAMKTDGNNLVFKDIAIKHAP